MKRLICSIAIFCVTSVLFGQTAKNNYALIFAGTGSMLGTKNTWTTDFESVLKEADNLAKDYTRPILIGHSQGGMRALNYANYLALNYNTSRQAEGVISVAGPVLGYTPLAGGTAVFATRVSTVTSDIENGLYATIYGGVSLILGPVAGGIGTPIGASVAHGLAVDYLGALIAPGFSDPNLNIDVNAIVKMALTRNVPENKNGSVFAVSNDVIRDFTPGSEYLKKYSLPTQVDNPAHSYAVENGWHFTYVWDYVTILGIKVGYWKLITVNDFKTVFVAATYKPNPHLDPNTRIAYLRGTNKDMASFSKESVEADGDVSETNYKKLSGYLDVAAGAMGVAGGVDAAIAVAATAGAVVAYATLNIPVGIALTIVAVEAGAYSVQAFTGSYLCSNKNYTVNTRIYNTAASDGFIPVEATSLPKAYTGGRGWGGTDPEVMDYPFTHLRMWYDDGIWGTGGDIFTINTGGDTDKLIKQYDVFVAKGITAEDTAGTGSRNLFKF